MYCGKKISVAMATYNGASFIEKQLKSIFAQTVVPDELIISDDGSKDDTLKIVERVKNLGGGGYRYLLLLITRDMVLAEILNGLFHIHQVITFLFVDKMTYGCLKRWNT